MAFRIKLLTAPEGGAVTAQRDDNHDLPQKFAVFGWRDWCCGLGLIGKWNALFLGNVPRNDPVESGR
jgi:hypothetical protein